MDKFLKKRPAPEEPKQPNPKKSKPMVKFNCSYSKEWPCIKASSKGENFAFCVACQVDISIGSGGKDDVRKHVKSAKHTANIKGHCSRDIGTFMNKEKDYSCIKAEVLWTQFVISKSLPLSTSDDFGNLLRQMCPDSNIASKFSCGRTKTTAIAGCISNRVTEELCQKMKMEPFAIGTDGSNDHNSKLYPMVVIMNDEATESITTELLCISELTEASTAVNICNLITSELERFQIPISNCIAFISDNANVMVGKKGGVSTLLKKEQPKMINIGCGCHLINLAVKKSVSVIPVKVDEFLTDIYFYFHHSEKRLAEFNDVQQIYNDEARQILKYCPTRWLCLTTSLQRVVQLWQPLYEYFKTVKDREIEALKKKEPKQSKDKAESVIDSWFQDKEKGSVKSSADVTVRHDRILDVLKSKKDLVYCTFLLWIMPTFDKYNKILQSEEPLIHKLNDIYLSLFRDILVKFVKADVISTNSCNITQINYEKEKHHISDKDLYIGQVAQGLLKNVKAQTRSEVFEKIKAFYISALDYMKNKFPINHTVLKKAKFVNIQHRSKASFTDVEFFNERTPVICSLDQLHEEFSLYQSCDLPSAVLSEERCDKQWNILLHHTNALDNSKPFKNLAQIALSVLSIPHSNASAERIFSLVKKNRSESRSRMSTTALSSLLVTKVRAASTASRPVKLTDEFLRKCKTATMSSLH